MGESLSATPRQRRAWVPGLIAGASDADPTTVVAIAVVGSTTLYGLSWVVLLVFPLLAVVQVVASRLGTVTGSDLQSVVCRAYGRPAQILLLISLLVVNVFTVTADLEGGAAAVGLLTGASWRWFVLPLAAAVVAVLVFGVYATVQRFLLVALAFLATYVLAAFLARPDWRQLLMSSVRPTLHFDAASTGGALAILGTTLTAYVYVWLTVEESESASTPSRLRNATGAVVGILVAVVLFWFILAATAATLGVHHRHVVTVADAAQALRPLAGPAAGGLFAVGLLASALVALPVIAATSAYVVGAQAGWRRGLSRPVRDAPAFYGIVVGGIAVGAAAAMVGLSPVHVLYLASIAGGLATPVGLVLLMAAATSGEVMGGHRVNGALRWSGWVVTGLLGALSCLYLVQQTFG